MNSYGPLPSYSRAGQVFYTLGNDVALTLLNAIESGCTTPARLRQKLGFAQTTTYRWLSRLDKVGLIDQRANESDELQLEVTQLGRDLIRRVLDELQAGTR